MRAGREQTGFVGTGRSCGGVANVWLFRIGVSREGIANVELFWIGVSCEGVANVGLFGIGVANEAGRTLWLLEGRS
jgi:hypothetical protein